MMDFYVLQELSELQWAIDGYDENTDRILLVSVHNGSTEYLPVELASQAFSSMLTDNPFYPIQEDSVDMSGLAS